MIHLLPRRRLSGLGFLKDPPALPLMCLRVTVRPDAALLAEILGGKLWEWKIAVFLIRDKVYLKTPAPTVLQIEIPKAFIRNEDQTPYFSLVLLNESPKALRWETKQIGFQLSGHLIRASSSWLLRQVISLSTSAAILLKSASPGSQGQMVRNVPKSTQLRGQLPDLLTMAL